MAQTTIVTDWYDGAVKPVRPGVYESESVSAPWFRYFDGKRWYYGDGTPFHAMYTFQILGFVLDGCPRWRGLREKA